MRKDRGFSLIEIMVVVVIIGVLAAVVVMNVTGRADDAKIAATKTKIRQIADAIGLFKMDNEVLPDRLDDLRTRPSYAKKWPTGSYLKEDAVDGWDRPFIYRKGTGDQGFELVSYGADGRPGGTNENEDIVYPAHK